jgi:hypothetical protein
MATRKAGAAKAPARPAAKPAAKAPARPTAHPDLEHLWLDQVEGDGRVRRRFYACTRPGCPARHELGKLEV